MTTCLQNQYSGQRKELVERQVSKDKGESSVAIEGTQQVNDDDDSDVPEVCPPPQNGTRVSRPRDTMQMPFALSSTQ